MSMPHKVLCNISTDRTSGCKGSWAALTKCPPRSLATMSSCVLRACISSWYRLIKDAWSTISLRCALISIFLALVANLRVLWVSSAWLEAGVIVQMTAMRAPLPVKELCSSCHLRSQAVHTPVGDDIHKIQPPAKMLTGLRVTAAILQSCHQVVYNACCHWWQDIELPARDVMGLGIACVPQAVSGSKIRDAAKSRTILIAKGRYAQLVTTAQMSFTTTQRL